MSSASPLVMAALRELSAKMDKFSEDLDNMKEALEILSRDGIHMHLTVEDQSSSSEGEGEENEHTVDG